MLQLDGRELAHIGGYWSESSLWSGCYGSTLNSFSTGPSGIGGQSRYWRFEHSPFTAVQANP